MPRATRTIIITFLVLAASTAQASVSEPAKPANRAQAVEVVRNLRRIVTPQGVERTETMRIGGIDQVVDVRGRDLRNPILLLLHGGPGFPESALAWWDTRDLEEYFTVVQWDQRGAGRTYLANDPAKVAPTMRPEQFVADTEELVTRLRHDYGKTKIFLLGHSWGSYIGLEVAERHPEWFHAYIGVGQAANTPESERRGYAFALAAAKRDGNVEATTQLEAIAPYVEAGRLIPLKKIVVQRRWLDHFGGAMAYRDGQSDGMAVRLSPDYTDEQAVHAYDGNDYSQNFLFSAVLGLDLSTIRKLRCPLILLEGRHDKTVNSDVAREWFQRVQAPTKQFFWFERSGHEVMTEEPGKVLLTLVEHARPYAASAGDVAPEGE